MPEVQISNVPHYVFFLIGTIDLLYPQIPADICISSAWDPAVYPYADLDPVSQYYEQCIQKQKLIYFQKLANIDMLTEAMNRNAYENMIRYLDEQELELHTTGVVLLDLDNLKEINDNFGHEKGDESLKALLSVYPPGFSIGTELFPNRWRRNLLIFP